MSTLEEAISIAARAHAGALDKSGAPYILHPLRVMFKMKTDEERIVAVLHDVVEDSDWTIERLREQGFTEEVLDAVDHMTRHDAETYETFVHRAARNPIALRVKIADVEDNLDLTRIKEPSERDYERIERYQKALAYLRERLAGNQ